jgi:hypothetical protein
VASNEAVENSLADHAASERAGQWPVERMGVVVTGIEDGALQGCGFGLEVVAGGCGHKGLAAAQRASHSIDRANTA